MASSISSSSVVVVDVLPSWRVESLNPNGPPAPAAWHPSGPSSFNNCGLALWSVSRTEWCKQTVATKPPRPPPVNYDEVAQGLSTVQRTYELPGR